WPGGRALVGFLWSRVLELAIPYRLGSRVARLIRDGDRVTGIALDAAHGRGVVRSRLGVLLDTGGFEWNHALTAASVPGLRAHPQTPPIGDGDGQLMAAELGAGLALMDQTTR